MKPAVKYLLHFFCVALLCSIALLSKAQLTSPYWFGNNVTVGKKAYAPSNTILEIGDTSERRALIIARVIHRDSVNNPSFGMMVYDKSDNVVYFRNRTAWLNISSGAIESDPSVPSWVKGITQSNIINWNREDSIQTVTALNDTTLQIQTNNRTHTVTIRGKGGTGSGTDSQTLGYVTSTRILSISNGNTVTLPLASATQDGLLSMQKAAQLDTNYIIQNAPGTGSNLATFPNDTTMNLRKLRFTGAGVDTVTGTTTDVLQVNIAGGGGGGGLSGLTTNKVVYATGATTATTTNLLSVGASRIGVDGATSTRGTLYFNDDANTTVQDDDAFIHFKIKDKGGYPSVAPRKMIYSIDPSAMGGSLTSKFGLYTFGLDYAPSINTPASDTGDVVASRGYNNPGYSTWKPNEPSYTWQHELRYHQAAGPKPAIEDFTAFQTPQQNGSRGFRPYNWFITHDGTQQQFAIRATRIQFGDTTSGTPKIDFTPGGPSTPGNFAVNDATVFTFVQPNYYPLNQSGVGGLIGGNASGVGIWNDAFKFKSGAITSPGSGTLSLGDATEPIVEGLQILTSSNEKQKWGNAAGAFPLRLWYNGNIWQLRNNNNGNSIFNIDDRASNNALSISDAGNVGIGTSGAPYRLYIASPSGTVGLGIAGLNTSGDNGILYGGTTTGYIAMRQSYINAAQGIWDYLDNQNNTSTSAHSVVQLLTQQNGGNPMLRFQRLSVANSFYHMGTKRSNNRLTITNDGNGVEDGNPIIDFHPTTLATTAYGTAGYNTDYSIAQLADKDFVTKKLLVNRYDTLQNFTITGQVQFNGTEYSNDFKVYQVDSFHVDASKVNLMGAVAYTSKQNITSGTATTIQNFLSRVIVNPGSVLATHTITMPAAPTDGQHVAIYFGGSIGGGSPVITTLTVSANSGQTLMQSTTPTTAVGGDCLIYTYNAANTTWYREK